MNDSELRTCPACGSEAAHYRDTTGFQECGISCTDCMFEIKASTKKEAIEAWNKQPQIEKLEDEIVKLVKLFEEQYEKNPEFVYFNNEADWVSWIESDLYDQVQAIILH